MPGSPLIAAYEIGRRYELGLDDDARRQGAHFTPPDVAELLVGTALAAWQGTGTPVVCDPSCGGGVFLVAAAEALRHRGMTVATVLEHVVGVDLDPGAAAASAAALSSWAIDHGLTGPTPRVVVADALGGQLARDLGPVDIVVGNPPFRNQLGEATARSTEERLGLAERFGDAASGYVDVAALFQLVGLELVGAGGVVTLIQPRSFLVARDAAAVRTRLLEAACLRQVWVPGEPIFEANVDVCATVVERRRASSVVRIVGGRRGGVDHGVVDSAELEAAPTWSPVWAAANDIPTVAAPEAAAAVGSIATATAGFRDQYYGLLAHLSEVRPTTGARLVTTAMIDPGICRWGRRRVTIAKRRRVTPWVDLASLGQSDERLAAWVGRLAVPKVLVATQTRVIEAVADPDGSAVPFTPVIAVVPTGDVGAAQLEAALLAPAATAWALHRFGGGGMSAAALKLAARQVLEIPLPIHRAPWDAAVALLPSASGTTEPGGWAEFGRLMNEAWGLDDEPLVRWWLDRLPRKVDRSSADSIH